MGHPAARKDSGIGLGKRELPQEDVQRTDRWYLAEVTSYMAECRLV